VQVLGSFLHAVYQLLAYGWRVILNFGSINIDNFYRVSALPTPGETIAAKHFEQLLGGKGINQSIAAQRAGADVVHVGCVGSDQWTIDNIKATGLQTQWITVTDHPTGHANICVDDAGENEIVIFGGANRAFDLGKCKQTLESFAEKKPWVVLQNEINISVEIAQYAQQVGSKVCYSAAPFDADQVKSILPYLDLLVLNQSEYAELLDETGLSAAELDVPMVLVTRGADGSSLYFEDSCQEQRSYPVEAIDTTGAGDTFLGYFIAALDSGQSTIIALESAAAAAAIQVTRSGASAAIPSQAEVLDFLQEQHP